MCKSFISAITAVKCSGIAVISTFSRQILFPRAQETKLKQTLSTTSTFFIIFITKLTCEGLKKMNLNLRWVHSTHQNIHMSCQPFQLALPFNNDIEIETRWSGIRFGEGAKAIQSEKQGNEGVYLQAQQFSQICPKTAERTFGSHFISPHHISKNFNYRQLLRQVYSYLLFKFGIETRGAQAEINSFYKLMAKNICFSTKKHYFFQVFSFKYIAELLLKHLKQYLEDT